MGRFGTYDIEYEDGTTESNVARTHIQAYPPGTGGSSGGGGASGGGGGGGGSGSTK